MPDYPSPQSFGEYDLVASRTDRFGGEHALAHAMQGVLGEAGSVLTAVKKHQRDATSFAAYKEVVLEELGDTLWYVSSVARHAGLSLVEVAKRLPRSRLQFSSSGVDVPFSALYSEDLAEEYEEDDEYMEELAKLGKEVGFLLSFPLEEVDSYQIRDQLGVALGSLVTVAHMSAISIVEVAKTNLRKILRRWPTVEYRTFERTFDSGAPSYEQLPHTLEVAIELVEYDDGRYFVYQSANGINIGDRLSDNISDPDFYRYHDVFHYAYAAVLHWSPVMRSLMKVKRKHDKATDENQDGARAAIIEEAVSAFVFSRAKSQSFFENVERGGLSYDLLKSIGDLTKGYEVEACPPWLWEEAILQGYEAFRFLRQHGSGIISINRAMRSLTIKALE